MSVHAWRLARLTLPLHRSHRLVPTPSERSPGWGQKLRTLGLTPQQESPHLSPLTTAVLGGSALGAGQGISAGCEEGSWAGKGRGCQEHSETWAGALCCQEEVEELGGEIMGRLGRWQPGRQAGPRRCRESLNAIRGLQGN